MKLLAFDIWGDFAHFRKFFTTTSPLSFSFPPPPTIAGILGAIYGCDKKSNQYLVVFGYDNCRLAIQILSNITKFRMGINLAETKGRNLKKPMSDTSLSSFRTLIRTEFLKSPKYRIYVNHTDETVHRKLHEYLKEGKSYFTISLGLSQLLASYKFVGEFEFEEIDTPSVVSLVTPIRMSLISPTEGVVLEEGKKYFKETVPIKMNPDRIVEIYDEVVFESSGETVLANVLKYQALNNGTNISFF